MNTIESPTEDMPMESMREILDETPDETFHTAEVVTVAGGHLAHDTYFSYLPTILPLLIQNLALNTTQAGLLSAVSQIPSVFQPLIGHVADRKNLKMLVVLAPAVSGILITLVGVTPSFGLVAFLLLLAGFSTAGFHAIAPSMVSAKSGRKLGRGMGFFMVGGELGYGIGPLIVVATVTYLGLKGLPWLMSLGILASIILYFRTRTISTKRQAHEEPSLPVREALAQMKDLILPIMAIVFISGFLTANLVNYLAVFMSSEGLPYWIAGGSLSILELAATVGVFLMGMVSDRLGQRNIVLIGTVTSSIFALLFLFVTGWMQFVMLLLCGLTVFIANPAFLAILQTRFPTNRSLANGMYMSTSFIIRAVVVVLVGALADLFGLRNVFIGSAAGVLLALPFIFMLPKK
jgi:MFS transporter, FSR family, fosmidomycin resistance protein